MVKKKKGQKKKKRKERGEAGELKWDRIGASGSA